MNYDHNDDESQGAGAPDSVGGARNGQDVQQSDGENSGSAIEGREGSSGSAGVRRDQRGNQPEDHRTGDPVPVEDELAQIRLLLAQQTQTLAFWSAPIPEPDTLRRYEEVVPGAANRILAMAEAQILAPSERADRALGAEIDSAKSDRAAATLFLLVFFVASVVFFAVGNLVAGSVFMSVPVLGLIKIMWPSRQAPIAPSNDQLATE